MQLWLFPTGFVGVAYLTFTFFHQLMHAIHKQEPTTRQTVAKSGFVSKTLQGSALPTGGFPQITLQLPRIGARHVWVWRIHWHAFTAGLYLLMVPVRSYLSIFLAKTSSIYAEICLLPPQNDLRAGWTEPCFWTFPRPLPKINHFMKEDNKSAKAEKSDFIPWSTMCGNLWTQNCQSSCWQRPPSEASSIVLDWMLRTKILCRWHVCLLQHLCFCPGLTPALR